MNEVPHEACFLKWNIERSCNTLYYKIPVQESFTTFCFSYLGILDIADSRMGDFLRCEPENACNDALGRVGGCVCVSSQEQLLSYRCAPTVHFCVIEVLGKSLFVDERVSKKTHGFRCVSATPGHS